MGETARRLRNPSRQENPMHREIVPVACLKDNFAFLLHDGQTGASAVVDVPEARPVADELARRGWRPDTILLTHHHGDHVQGVPDLVAMLGSKGTRPRVVGAAADAHRLPPLDLAVAPGDTLMVGGVEVRVLDAPGHTIGHVAYHAPAARAVFTGDSLMALGCGRLFEGSAAQMWDTMLRLSALPDDTQVFSGHDYMAGNAAFAATVDPDNTAAITRAAAHRMGLPDRLFTTIAEEKATNPFLRADLSALRAAVGLPGAPAPEVFAALRAAKDSFRP
jgi:hydroxyacylglutathione hydrolase